MLDHVITQAEVTGDEDAMALKPLSTYNTEYHAEWISGYETIESVRQTLSSSHQLQLNQQESICILYML
eukprot:4735434-Amphidinium_carterae.1